MGRGIVYWFRLMRLRKYGQDLFIPSFLVYPLWEGLYNFG